MKRLSGKLENLDTPLSRHVSIRRRTPSQRWQSARRKARVRITSCMSRVLLFTLRSLRFLVESHTIPWNDSHRYTRRVTYVHKFRLVHLTIDSRNFKLHPWVLLFRYRLSPMKGTNATKIITVDSINVQFWTFRAEKNYDWSAEKVQFFTLRYFLLMFVQLTRYPSDNSRFFICCRLPDLRLFFNAEQIPFPFGCRYV